MDARRTPADALRAIGMHPKYRGYAYLLCILQETGRDPERIYSITKELYPLVCQRFGVSRAAVERNIRFAIRRTWECGGNPALRQVFSAYDLSWVPTNIEFICVLTESICFGRLGNGG